MSVISASGITEPFQQDGIPYAPFSGRTPALRSFRLTFPSDREVVLIQVLPGGTPEDLSPNADIGPARFPDGQLHLAFQDSTPSGNEFQYSIAHSVMAEPKARRFQIRDVGCVGTCSREIPQNAFQGDGLAQPDIGPHVIALTGFKLFFTGNRQRELDRVGVWFQDHTLHVAMRDQNAERNDVFSYLIDFVVIPTAGWNVTRNTDRGQARGLETIQLPTPSRAHFVLTGWQFNFQDGDHDIRDIGVFRREDDFTVIYSADGANAPFDWRVDWAHISPVVVGP